MTRVGATGEKNPLVSIASGTYFASGVGVLIQSGAGVILESGLFVVVESGMGVTIQSGVGVQIQSGAGVLVSGQLTTESGIGVQIQSGAGVQVQSGIGVLVSGQLTTQSGIGVTINSGVGVTVNSGVGVNIGSAYVIMQSGTATVDIIVPGTPLINNSGNPLVLTSGISGGTPLWSAACISVTIKALSTNSGDLYVGGYTAGQAPYSGVGFVLQAGEAINIDVNNVGKVRVCNALSGDKVTYIAIAT